MESERNKKKFIPKECFCSNRRKYIIRSTVHLYEKIRRNRRKEKGNKKKGQKSR